MAREHYGIPSFEAHMPVNKYVESSVNLQEAEKNGQRHYTRSCIFPYSSCKDARNAE